MAEWGVRLRGSACLLRSLEKCGGGGGAGEGGGGSGVWSDVTVTTGRGTASRAHSLVLASLSRPFADLLLSAGAGPGECLTLLLPDLEQAELEAALRDIYSGRPGSATLLFLKALNLLERGEETPANVKNIFGEELCDVKDEPLGSPETNPWVRPEDGGRFPKTPGSIRDVLKEKSRVQSFASKLMTFWRREVLGGVKMGTGTFPAWESAVVELASVPVISSQVERLGESLGGVAAVTMAQLMAWRDLRGLHGLATGNKKALKVPNWTWIDFLVFFIFWSFKVAGRDIETWAEQEWLGGASKKDQDQHPDIKAWKDQDRLLDSGEMKVDDQPLDTDVLEKLHSPPCTLALEAHLEEQGHHFLLVVEQPGGGLVRGNMARQLVARRLEEGGQASRELGEFIDTTVEAFLEGGHRWFLMLEEEGETGVRGDLAPDQVRAILDRESLGLPESGSSQAGNNQLQTKLKTVCMIPTNVGQDKDTFDCKDFGDTDDCLGAESDQDDIKDEDFGGTKSKKMAFKNGKTLNTKYQCDEPGCTFRSYKGPYQVKEHFERIHVLVPCEHCGKELQKKKINRHIRIKHNKGKFKCDKCDAIYNKRCTLREHKSSVHDPTRHVCDHCGKDYATKFILQQHIRNFHSGGLPQRCDQCDYQVIGPKEVMKVHKLVMHAATVLEAQVEQKCSYCDYTTESSRQLINHKTQEHGIMPPDKTKRLNTMKGQTFDCTFCNTKQNSRQSLKSHIDSVHLNVKNDCPHCDFKSTSKGSLKFHIDGIHLDKKVKCKHCDFRCTLKYSMQIHMARLHGIQMEMYTCEHCKYRCQKEEAMMRHILINHN